MPIAQRALVLLAVVMPLFAATAFHPAWWQTFIAAVIGSALGQLTAMLTHGRRAAAWAVIGAATLSLAVTVGWIATHKTAQRVPSGDGFLVVGSRDGASPSITWDDISAIRTVPSIRFAAPYLHKSVQLLGEDRNWNSNVVGTTPEYLDVRTWELAAGKRFTEADATTKVVVLGDTVAKQLFAAGVSPVGASIRINSTPYEVIGVLAHHGMTPEGLDNDDVALVPIDVFRSKITGDSGRWFHGVVFVAASSPGETPRAEAELRVLLRDRHRLSPGAEDDFVIRRPNPE